MKRVYSFLICCLIVSTSYGAGVPDLSVDPEYPTLTVLNGAEPATLDSSLMTDTISARIHQTLFEGLVTCAREGGGVEPGVALSWEINGEGTKYVFTLRESSWSDGVPITARTVVDSWLRTLNPGTASSYAWLISSVVAGAAEYNAGKTSADTVRIRAVGEYRLEAELVTPLPYFIDMLPHPAFGILPLHIIEQYGDRWTLPENIVSNGPFVLEDWKPQESLTVVKNPGYWDSERVKLQSIVFIPSEDQGTRLGMYLNGEADWMIGGVPPDQMRVVAQRGDFHLVPSQTVVYVGFNHRNPTLADVRVRKALTGGVDKDLMVGTIMSDAQLRADTVVPPMGGYTPPEGTIVDVSGARRLLGEAGFPEGADFPTLTLLHSTLGSHRRMAEFLQHQWEVNLGLTVNMLSVEFKSLILRAREGEFDMVILAWLGDYPDPNAYLELFVTGSPLNTGGFTNAEFDETFTSAASTTGSARFALLRRAEEILIAEQQAVLPLIFYSNHHLIDTDLWGGWSPSSLGYYPFKYIFRRETQP